MFYGCVSRCPTNIPTKEDLALILEDTYALPTYLSELISMMLDHKPSERPPIDMICLAVEDNLDFPKRIEINGGGQILDPMTPDITDYSFVKPFAQEWVERELDRERKSSKVCQTPPPPCA